MYVEMIFSKHGQVIDLSNPSHKQPVRYTVNKPAICQMLPEDAGENKLNTHKNGDMSYYMDCGQLDRDTVDRIVSDFSIHNLDLERFGTGNFNYSRTSISDPTTEGKEFVDTLSAMLVKAKREHAANKQPVSQPFITNRNLFFAATGLAVGIAGTALTLSMKPM